MKTLLLIPVFLLSVVFTSQAQSPSSKHKRQYKTWISFQGDKVVRKGVLYETRDSSILILTSEIKTDPQDINNNLAKFDIKNIDVIKVRRKNAIGRGMLIGGITGAALGTLMGLTSSNTAENEKVKTGVTFTAVIGGSFFFGAIGAAIGAAFGPSKKSIHIRGKQMLFEKQRDILDKRALNYPPAAVKQ
jgi:hypothetical protein